MKEVRPFETTDLALTAVFRMISSNPALRAIFKLEEGFRVELDPRDPERIIFLVTPADKAEEVAKDYFYHRTILKHKLYTAKKDSKLEFQR